MPKSKKNTFVVRATIPSVRPHGIQVNVQGDRLTLPKAQIEKALQIKVRRRAANRDTRVKFNLSTRGALMMRTNTNADSHAVATVLGGVTVIGAQNMLTDTATPGIEGARAALETFHYAFNTRSLDLLRQIWADDPLVQLDSPVAGLVRGSASITTLYERGFSGSAQVQTVLDDIVAYVSSELVVFAGQERGSYAHDAEHDRMSELPRFHSICVFRFIATQGGWRQVCHQVSLDNPDQLAQYQRAVRGGDQANSALESGSPAATENM